MTSLPMRALNQHNAKSIARKLSYLRKKIVWFWFDRSNNKDGEWRYSYDEEDYYTESQSTYKYATNAKNFDTLDLGDMDTVVPEDEIDYASQEVVTKVKKSKIKKSEPVYVKPLFGTDTLSKPAVAETNKEFVRIHLNNITYAAAQLKEYSNSFKMVGNTTVHTNLEAIRISIETAVAHLNQELVE